MTFMMRSFKSFIFYSRFVWAKFYGAEIFSSELQLKLHQERVIAGGVNQEENSSANFINTLEIDERAQANELR